MGVETRGGVRDRINNLIGKRTLVPPTSVVREVNPDGSSITTFRHEDQSFSLSQNSNARPVEVLWRKGRREFVVRAPKQDASNPQVEPFIYLTADSPDTHIRVESGVSVVEAKISQVDSRIVVEDRLSKGEVTAGKLVFKNGAHEIVAQVPEGTPKSKIQQIYIEGTGRLDILAANGQPGHIISVDVKGDIGEVKGSYMHAAGHIIERAVEQGPHVTLAGNIPETAIERLPEPYSDLFVYDS